MNGWSSEYPDSDRLLLRRERNWDGSFVQDTRPVSCTVLRTTLKTGTSAGGQYAQVVNVRYSGSISYISPVYPELRNVNC